MPAWLDTLARVGAAAELVLALVALAAAWCKTGKGK